MDKSIVIKIGGSLIFDSHLSLNSKFLNKVINWVTDYSDRYQHIVIIVGGGSMARHLLNQVRPYVKSKREMHEIGIEVTHTNAVMLSSIVADREVYVPKSLGDALEAIVADKRKFVISGGLKRGWSTDMDAAVMADVTGADRVYKLSNTDYIYTDDPKISTDSRPIKELSWREYFTQFGVTPDGGVDEEFDRHIPIGRFASQFAARKGISFFLSGGTNFEKYDDLADILESGSFVHP